MSKKKEQRESLIRRAEHILRNKPFTQEDTALFNSLMRLSDALLVDGEPSTTVVADDLSSTGFVLTENTGAGADEAEISFGGVTFGKSFFSTGIMLVSSQLADDISSWT